MFSIIIPFHNEEKYLPTFLMSLKNMDNNVLNDSEIIFVDGDSSDKSTSIIAEAFNSTNLNYKIITNKKKIVPISLNMGIKISKGSPIIRLDVHTFYPSNYISELIIYFNKLNADNVGGISIAKSFSSSNKGTLIAMLLRTKFGVGNSSFRTGVDKITETDTVVYGCYNRDVFEKIGYFNEKLERNQDIEFNSRIKQFGGKIFTIPTINSYYFPGDDYIPFFVKSFKNGLWNIKTIKITNKIKSLRVRHFIPLFFLIYIMTIPLGFVFSAYYYFIPLFIYFILGLYTALVNKLNFKNSMTFLLIALVTHISYGFGSLLGLLKFKKLIPYL
jgi:glycosyltransferase involved in cell wall biosynthesis